MGRLRKLGQLSLLRPLGRLGDKVAEMNGTAVKTGTTRSTETTEATGRQSN